MVDLRITAWTVIICEQGFVKQTLQENIGKKVFAGHMGKVDKVTHGRGATISLLLSWKQALCLTQITLPLLTR